VQEPEQELKDTCHRHSKGEVAPGLGKVDAWLDVSRGYQALSGVRGGSAPGRLQRMASGLSSRTDPRDRRQRTMNFSPATALPHDAPGGLHALPEKDEQLTGDFFGVRPVHTLRSTPDVPMCLLCVKIEIERVSRLRGIKNSEYKNSGVRRRRAGC
jgi:hypothetical protein